ncbi:MAG: nitrophenyl compound nitroreductase subunit ArsF family protein, partial [Deltaproteobacteria bacterium]
LGYAVVKESGFREEPGSPALPVTKGTTKTETLGVTEAAKPESTVVAYYFHGNTRCVTCRTIESYAKEAIESGFPKALKKGQLGFKVVNVEEPQNEHFVQDYQLSASSVVLARFERGKQRDWKNLQLVWDLVRDHDAFVIYVQEEAESFLGEGS